MISLNHMKKKAKKVSNKKRASSKPRSVSIKQSTRSQGKILPINDRVLIKPLSAEELSTTTSGIIIPDTVSKEKPEQGVVVAVGLGRWENGERVPVQIKVGDRVVFSRYGYDDIKVDGEEYYILKEENILAIINK